MRLAAFLAPVVLLVCYPVYLIDPYGLFSHASPVSDSVRHENAFRVNHVLLSIISFTKRPTPNILLGDSQMMHFKAEDIEAVTHQPYSNLAYGGGTLAESIETFWYASRLLKLHRVYFGASFYSFTDSSRNRVGEAVHIVNDRLAYFSGGDVLEAAWDDLLEQFFHREVNYQPTVSAPVFWQQQLSELARRKQTYSAQESTISQIRAIVDYCRKNAIELFFVIPPEHEEVRVRMREMGMQDMHAAFKSAVFNLGPTYDCDVANDITRDRSNFVDPFHTTPAAASMIVKSLWSGGQEWCELRRSN